MSLRKIDTERCRLLILRPEGRTGIGRKRPL